MGFLQNSFPSLSCYFQFQTQVAVSLSEYQTTWGYPWAKFKSKAPTYFRWPTLQKGFRDNNSIVPVCNRAIYRFNGTTIIYLLCPSCVGVGGFSKVAATHNHVGETFNLFMVTTGDVWIIQSFQIWDYVLHVEHIWCVITNCGQHQWLI